MVERGRTRYAKSGAVHVAYQVMGTGPLDLVYVEGFLTHLDVLWELPAYRHFCERLASFSRLIRFDKRGMGLSDHVQVGTLEERMEDLRAVLDAVGSERAVFLGVSEGGPLAPLFAATYPECTQALILCASALKERKTDDWPWGHSTEEEFERNIGGLADGWGDGGDAAHFAPSLASPALEEGASIVADCSGYDPSCGGYSANFPDQTGQQESEKQLALQDRAPASDQMVTIARHALGGML